MKTPHSFNEEKRRAGLPIGSFQMQSVPDQAPAAGQAEHSLLPWRTENGTAHVYIIGSDGRYVGRTRDDQTGVNDAAFIVRACNSHAQLRHALEALAIECQLSRKYIVLSDDNGLKAYNDTATALGLARAALQSARE